IHTKYDEIFPTKYLQNTNSMIASVTIYQLIHAMCDYIRELVHVNNGIPKYIHRHTSFGQFQPWKI
ncbi:hypothetical protein BLOT_014277, partial [Blomia tropicalis]